MPPPDRSDAVNPIIGYNVLPASYNLAALTPGRSLDTTDTAKSGNTVQGVPGTLVVNVTSNSGTGAQVSHCMLSSGCMNPIVLRLDGMHMNALRGLPLDIRLPAMTADISCINLHVPSILRFVHQLAALLQS